MTLWDCPLLHRYLQDILSRQGLVCEAQFLGCRRISDHCTIRVFKREFLEVIDHFKLVGGCDLSIVRCETLARNDFMFLRVVTIEASYLAPLIADWHLIMRILLSFKHIEFHAFLSREPNLR